MKPLIAFDFVPLGRDEVKCNQRPQKCQRGVLAGNLGCKFIKARARLHSIVSTEGVERRATADDQNITLSELCHCLSDAKVFLRALGRPGLPAYQEDAAPGIASQMKAE
eukprot:gene21777-biopygen1850